LVFGLFVAALSPWLFDKGQLVVGVAVTALSGSLFFLALTQHVAGHPSSTPRRTNPNVAIRHAYRAVETANAESKIVTENWATSHAAFGYNFSKRVVDITISIAIFILGSPLWLLIALMIRLTSRGPVLFRGTVVGKGGRQFEYFKFRTMTSGDNSAHEKWLEDFVKKDTAFATDGTGKQVFKVVDDPRITRVGTHLRKLGLDEVPQMINVLRGEMSLVGPRPPVVYEYKHYDSGAKQRLSVLPGITGLYQVTARSQVGFSEMLAIDLEYIRRRSIFLDLWIIFKTPIVMLMGEGAT
jgi:lipopolysaccharide/colanic/teichoic acid biosynthesis glycosyltransferase